MPSHPLHHRQCGAAALFVIVMLCFVMVLAVALAQRNLVVEEQRSANDLRASAAFEAADAGLEWALARINDPAPIDAACLPSADVLALPLRSRMLGIDVASGAIAPRTWSDAGVARPLRAACIRGAEGWSCSCPADGPPVLPRVDGNAAAPAFFVELAPGSRPEIVGIVATGCTRVDGDGACAGEDAAGHEANARMESAWALLPALRSSPAAALTAAGEVDLGAAALGVHNRDRASGGVALHAGGRIAASALRISAPPGASLGTAIVSGDATLRDLPSERLFARFFGMSWSAWASQPAARRIRCDGDCTAAIAEAIAAGARLLAVDGDAALGGPIALGAPDDPIVLAAHGALRFTGDVEIHGVVHGTSFAWNDAAPGHALVHGAVVVGGDVRGDAGADIERDGALLSRLARASGSFVRVHGSWKDF